MSTNLAVNLTGSSDKNERVSTDFYPTPANVTRALIEFLHNNDVLEPYSTIWEPACGDGAMSRVLESYGYKVHSTDIREDSGYGLGGIDFITADPIECQSIVTNPPFFLASRFIEKSLESAPIVAMLFKSQVWHAENKAKLFIENPPTFVLPLDWRPDFLNGKRGGAPTMECLWTVWIRGKTDTRYRILQKPNR